MTMSPSLSALPVTRLNDDLLRQWPLPMPAADGDKEERGRILIVGGARQMPGAVILAANAAMRAGAGSLGSVVASTWWVSRACTEWRSSRSAARAMVCHRSSRGRSPIRCTSSGTPRRSPRNEPAVV